MKAISEETEGDSSDGEGEPPERMLSGSGVVEEWTDLRGWTGLREVGR